MKKINSIENDESIPGKNTKHPFMFIDTKKKICKNKNSNS